MRKNVDVEWLKEKEETTRKANKKLTNQNMSFTLHGVLNVFASVDILLTSVDDADVTSSERQSFVLENVARVRSLVHQI